MTEQDKKIKINHNSYNHAYTKSTMFNTQMVLSYPFKNIENVLKHITTLW